MKSTDIERFLSSRKELFLSQDRRLPFEVIKRGDVTIIPIFNHSEEFSKYLPHLKPFRDAINEAEFLFMEGYSEVGKLRSSTSPRSFESLATKTFSKKNLKRNLFYLEEGINYRTLGEKYGINPDWQIIYRFLRSLIIQVGQKGRKFSLPDFVQVSTNFMPGYSTVADYERLRKLFQKTFIDISSANLDPEEVASYIEKVDQAFYWYFGRVRDYEFICPTILKHLKELKGKSVIVVGSGHIPLIEKTLEGETLEAPVDWKTFINQLPPDYLKAFLFLHRIMGEPQ